MAAARFAFVLLVGCAAESKRAAHDAALRGRELFVALESHPQLGTAVQVWDVDRGALVRSFGLLDEVATAAGLAFGDALYVSDAERGRVLRFDPDTGALLDVLIAGLDAPLALELAGDVLYVLDATGISRFDPTTGAPLGQLVSVGDGVLERPRGFTFTH